MKLSRRSFIAGLLGSAAVGPVLAACVQRSKGYQELAVDLSGLRANAAYDVFVWNDGGIMKLATGPAWEDATHRGTAALVKENDQWLGARGEGLYVGTVRMNDPPSFYRHATRTVRELV